MRERGKHMNLICNDATTPQALRDEIVIELEHRAWQSRAAASVGRTNKHRTSAAERAAQELENFANDLKRMQLTCTSGRG
jgi:hypothetical protein